MADLDESRAGVHDSLRRVSDLLHKNELAENLVHRQEGPRQDLVESLVHKLHLVAATEQLDTDEIADLAPDLPREVMQPEFIRFHPQEKAQDAANAFERYDLVSAPTVDEGGGLIGRVTVNAAMGVAIPLAMQKLGRDPALGASVMITAITDSGGFFIFLGLATVFLV